MRVFIRSLPVSKSASEAAPPAGRARTDDDQMSNEA